MLHAWCLLAWAIFMTVPLNFGPNSVFAGDSPGGHPPKRIVLCLDGTWNNTYNQTQREDGHLLLKPANPLKLCRVVLPFDEKTGRQQITYYHAGVGALALYPGLSNQLLRKTDHYFGGVWGAGFEENVESAVHFLMQNFEAGDEVFIFGFSRGAATARAVTEFLAWNGGLPEKEDAYYLPRFFLAYVQSHGDVTARDKEVEAINADRHNEHTKPLPPLKPFRPVRVKYLGVWDTVMALGGRFAATSESTSVGARSFYAGATPAERVEHARQALAIDEHRFDFRPEIWTGHLPNQKMKQRWFAGVHANIGGGYLRDGLANIAFKWVLDGAKEEGLVIDEDFALHYKGDGWNNLHDSYSFGYFLADLIRWRPGGAKRSLVELPPGANADLDPSVIVRMNVKEFDTAGDGSAVRDLYRPENVLLFLAEQPNLDEYLTRIGVKDTDRAALSDDVKKKIAELKRERGSIEKVDAFNQ